MAAVSITACALPLRALEAVRKAVGDDFPILGKMGLTDAVRGGLSRDEAIEVAAHLDKGGIDALITSGGTSSYNVMHMFRGDSIAEGMAGVTEQPNHESGFPLYGAQRCSRNTHTRSSIFWKVASGFVTG